MKQLLLAFSLFISQSLFAQEDPVPEIAEKTCDCIEEKEIDSQTDNWEMKFGLCLIEQAMPYSKEIKAQYGIDLDRMDASVGEALGQLVGVRMASRCPQVFENFDSADFDEDEREEGYVRGKVLEVSTDRLVTIHLKGEDGKIYKLLWADSFEGDNELIFNYREMIGEMAYFEFKIEEYFDARIDEYIPFRIITSYNPVNDSDGSQ